MLYTLRLSHTPALEPCEFGDRALIIDTETLGAGPSVGGGDLRAARDVEATWKLLRKVISE